MASNGMKSMNLTADQIQLLEDNFNKVTRHPDDTTLMLFAAECGLSEEETQRWFNVRNAQWRQEQGFPAKGGSVMD